MNGAVLPDIRARLTLAASQMLIYHERFQPSKSALILYDELVTLGSHLLEGEHKKKVALEFVASVKDAEIQCKVSVASVGAGAGEGDSTEPSSRSEHEERTKDRAKGGLHGNEGRSGDDDDDDDDDDDVLDSMLDKILDAEAGGYGHFEDDFDPEEGEEGGMTDEERGEVASGAYTASDEEEEENDGI